MQVMRHVYQCLLAGTIASTVLAAPVLAEVATETSAMGDFTITLYLHDFLTQDDLTTLRIVAKDKNALAMFVPEGGGFAALAASPDDGFIKDGMPATSASALSGLPDAASAAAQAIAACQAASKAKTPCVVLLEVAPKQ